MVRITNAIYNIYKKYIFVLGNNKHSPEGYVKEYAIGAITLFMLFNIITIGRFFTIYIDSRIK